MAATCPDPVYVGHFARHTADGQLVAARHYRLNAPHADAATAIARAMGPQFFVLHGVREAGAADKQTWLVMPS